MKKPKDSLHRLVVAMSPAEKRYFKVHFGQSEGSVLTELFDIVNGLKEYDEAIVKKRLGKQGGRHLKVYKVQLTELLLKTLTLFHSKKNIGSKIRIGLEEVDILMDKELYDLAAERLDKLKKLCETYQEYPFLIEIINRDLRLNHIQYEKIGASQMPLYEALRTCLTHLQEQLDYAEAANNLLDINRARSMSTYTAEDIAYCQQLLDSPLLKKNTEPTSLRARLARNTLFTFLYSIIGDEARSLRYRERSVLLFRQNQAYAQYHSFDFLNTLRNLLNSYLKSHQFVEAEYLIKEAIAFADKHALYREQLVYFHYARLVSAYHQNRFDFIINELEPHLVEQLARYHIQYDRIGMIIWLYLAITHIIQNDHRQAQQYLRQLEEAPEELRTYFQPFFTIVAFISHYTSDEHILLSNLLKPRLRQAAKQKTELPFYAHILRFFKKLIDQPFQADQLAQQFILQLEKMEKDALVGMFYYFRLENWLLALANRRTLTEEMLAEHKKT
ncbi:MAG TPA: hypothetical protein PKC76_10705 [Saprospiraceae bacterium]|nr:hypothetical protein [Saprospiraceae bacterium]HMP24594.1 hypothetical protein [Saprospiraceae bacterium]